MMKTDTLNRSQMASLIHYNHPEIRRKDAEAVLKAQEEVIIHSLDHMQKVKLGKLLVIEPYIKPKRKHYDAINHKHIELKDRLRFRFRALKNIQDLERDYTEH